MFNRLDTTKQVFEAIRKAKPPRLYIAADGARESKVDEDEKVKAVRDYIMSNIDWDCEVQTLFREKNLGCKIAVSSAIDWFFENEEMGIILEDDCLPSQSFFWFCEELLEKYKNDMRVGQISGDNFQNGIKRGDADYYFSIYNHIWGWASWANRWEKYDVELNNIKDTVFIDDLILEKTTKLHWIKVLRKMKQKKIDTWDYQWTFTLWNNKQLTVLPNVNLVENIGFGIDATHTQGESEFANLKSYGLVLKNHPIKVLRNYEADEFTSRLIFNQKSIFIRIVDKLKKIIGTQL
ncbi:glycosyltransferase family 2 protein [Sulfurovum sp.]|uniref:glycosyltransferase family 2 protein n=1 Tax=Sulfurovum sp. TaxID=1969726 RepID=UPI00356A14A5